MVQDLVGKQNPKTANQKIGKGDLVLKPYFFPDFHENRSFQNIIKIKSSPLSCLRLGSFCNCPKDKKNRLVDLTISCLRIDARLKVVQQVAILSRNNVIM